MFGPDNLPIVVDLDGTLILNNSSITTLKKYIQNEPLGIFLIPFWWIRGNAFVKRELAKRVPLLSSDFQYNDDLIDALKKEKKKGRKLILATGADQIVAEKVIEELDLFDDVVASDGNENKVSFKKAEHLNKLFGNKNYVYVGNSTQDYAVWVDSAHAVAVNAPDVVLEKLSMINVSQEIF